MIDEIKLKGWLKDNVIGNCNYGTEWKEIMRKELDEAIQEGEQ